MSSTVASNAWAEIIHHETDGILELRWLPSKMSDGAFKATLALFVWEAEKLRPLFLLIDGNQFRHQFGPNVMQWRDDCIIPALRRRRHEEIRVPYACGLSQHDGSRRQGGRRRPRGISDGMVLRAQACAGLVPQRLNRCKQSDQGKHHEFDVGRGIRQRLELCHLCNDGRLVRGAMA